MGSVTGLRPSLWSDDGDNENYGTCVLVMVMVMVVMVMVTMMMKVRMMMTLYGRLPCMYTINNRQLIPPPKPDSQIALADGEYTLALNESH